MSVQVFQPRNVGSAVSQECLFAIESALVHLGDLGNCYVLYVGPNLVTLTTTTRTSSGLLTGTRSGEDGVFNPESLKKVSVPTVV